MTISMTAVCCSVLQCVAACCIEQLDDNFKPFYSAAIPQHTATHCSTLKHAATHCNTLQHTPTHSNTLQRTSSWMTISTTVLFRPLSVTHQPLHMYVETHTQTQCHTHTHTHTHIPRTCACKHTHTCTSHSHLPLPM